MALITCPDCGREVSDKAVSCPQCGCLRQNASAQPGTDSPGPPFAVPSDLGVAPPDETWSQTHRPTRPAQPPLTPEPSPSAAHGLVGRIGAAGAVVIGLICLVVIFVQKQPPQPTLPSTAITLRVVGGFFGNDYEFTNASGEPLTNIHLTLRCTGETMDQHAETEVYWAELPVGASRCFPTGPTAYVRNLQKAELFGNVQQKGKRYQVNAIWTFLSK